MISIEIVVIAKAPVAIAGLPIPGCLNVVLERPVVQHRQIEARAVPGHKVRRVTVDAIIKAAHQLSLVRARVAQAPDFETVSRSECDRDRNDFVLM